MIQEQAQELLENYFVKLNCFAGNNDSLRNIVLGTRRQDRARIHDLRQPSAARCSKLRGIRPEV